MLKCLSVVNMSAVLLYHNLIRLNENTVLLLHISETYFWWSSVSFDASVVMLFKKDALTQLL